MENYKEGIENLPKYKYTDTSLLIKQDKENNILENEYQKQNEYQQLHSNMSNSDSDFSQLYIQRDLYEDANNCQFFEEKNNIDQYKSKNYDHAQKQITQNQIDKNKLKLDLTQVYLVKQQDEEEERQYEEYLKKNNIEDIYQYTDKNQTPNLQKSNTNLQIQIQSNSSSKQNKSINNSQKSLNQYDKDKYSSEKQSNQNFVKISNQKTYNHKYQNHSQSDQLNYDNHFQLNNQYIKYKGTNEKPNNKNQSTNQSFNIKKNYFLNDIQQKNYKNLSFNLVSQNKEKNIQYKINQSFIPNSKKIISPNQNNNSTINNFYNINNQNNLTTTSILKDLVDKSNIINFNDTQLDQSLQKYNLNKNLVEQLDQTQQQEFSPIQNNKKTEKQSKKKKYNFTTNNSPYSLTYQKIIRKTSSEQDNLIAKSNRINRRKISQNKNKKFVLNKSINQYNSNIQDFQNNNQQIHLDDKSTIYNQQVQNMPQNNNTLLQKNKLNQSNFYNPLDNSFRVNINNQKTNEKQNVFQNNMFKNYGQNRYKGKKQQQQLDVQLKQEKRNLSLNQSLNKMNINNTIIGDQSFFNVNQNDKDKKRTNTGENIYKIQGLQDYSINADNINSIYKVKHQRNFKINKTNNSFQNLSFSLNKKDISFINQNHSVLKDLNETNSNLNSSLSLAKKIYAIPQKKGNQNRIQNKNISNITLNRNLQSNEQYINNEFYNIQQNNDNQQESKLSTRRKYRKKLNQISIEIKNTDKIIKSEQSTQKSTLNYQSPNQLKYNQLLKASNSIETNDIKQTIKESNLNLQQNKNTIIVKNQSKNAAAYQSKNPTSLEDTQISSQISAIRSKVSVNSSNRNKNGSQRSTIVFQKGGAQEKSHSKDINELKITNDDIIKQKYQQKSQYTDSFQKKQKYQDTKIKASSQRTSFQKPVNKIPRRPEIQNQERSFNKIIKIYNNDSSFNHSISPQSSVRQGIYYSNNNSLEKQSRLNSSIHKIREKIEKSNTQKSHFKRKFVSKTQNSAKEKDKELKKIVDSQYNYFTQNQQINLNESQSIKLNQDFLSNNNENEQIQKMQNLQLLHKQNKTILQKQDKISNQHDKKNSTKLYTNNIIQGQQFNLPFNKQQQFENQFNHAAGKLISSQQLALKNDLNFIYLQLDNINKLQQQQKLKSQKIQNSPYKVLEEQPNNSQSYRKQRKQNIQSFDRASIDNQISKMGMIYSVRSNTNSNSFNKKIQSKKAFIFE
ncbi:hypothetical protein PPERSA_01128 [Pseudocohnilembus persalinus]|uniref:Uncharacterized protein n=1 Tax=Pseudocohnilembus persalinus TaxID=266149 RepID=A0A0V0QUT5_PSEPJ|nr:hypothetical protein PPERSA_01128 [Pseudocohnilembus persalinus]|eukprot:KRX06050.1 hypothetical protein PPERSA_01128 [Pseudocohnilembus persalinus]